MNVEQINRMLEILDRDGKRLDEDKRSDAQLKAIYENAANEEKYFPRHESTPESTIEEIANDIFWVYVYLNRPQDFKFAVQKFFENNNHPLPSAHQLRCAAIVKARHGLRSLIGHIETFCKLYQECFDVSVPQPRRLLDLARHRINYLLGPIDSVNQLDSLHLPREMNDYLLSAYLPLNNLFA